MTEKRLKYYIFPLCGGALYFFSYVLLILFLYSFLTVIDMSFLIASYIFLCIFILKDILDEMNLRSGEDPIGSNKFEHAPFIFFISFHAFISLNFNLDVFLFIIKIILFIGAFCDGIFDLLQDLRVK
ncbi:MAG: hypothetical protein EAX96_04510 [Candidatus Lokiarchaeota archaeon]|nr:hypothetical protein [Candidatus Lokiarchaeota archaeon]